MAAAFFYNFSILHFFNFYMLHIRKADTDDCQLIHDLAWQVFPETYKDILTPEQNDYMMEWMYSLPNLHRQMADGHVYFIGFEGETPVGYVSIQQEQADLFHLQKIYVLPHCQGFHYGRQLFDAAVDYIRAEHPAPCTMELNVNRNNRAVTFYERMGMHKARSGDFPIGQGFYMNDYIMAMEVSGL